MQNEVRLANRFSFSQKKEFDEYSDLLNYKYSCFLFFILGGFLLLKQYLWEEVSCYIATSTGGHHLEAYLESYCFANGIVPLSLKSLTPTGEAEWKSLEKMKITYYQLIPFILFLQGIGCFFPKLSWSLLRNQGSGREFENIISRAFKANSMDESKRNDEVIRLAKLLEKLLYKNETSKTENNPVINQNLRKIRYWCIMLTKSEYPMILFYILAKLLYVTNSTLQILFIKSFFTANGTSDSIFNIKTLRGIFTANDWESSLLFPKIGYCFAKIRQLSSVNYVTAQCVLPLNRLNESIYVFLFIWMSLMWIVNVTSLVMWIVRVFLKYNKTHFLKTYLRLSGDYCFKDLNDKRLNHFESYFVKQDGMFVLRMMSSCAGNMITAQVVSQLWKIYSQAYPEVTELNVEDLKNRLLTKEDEYIPLQIRSMSLKE